MHVRMEGIMGNSERKFLGNHLEVNLVIVVLICVLLGLIIFWGPSKPAPPAADKPQIVTKGAIPLPSVEVSPSQPQTVRTADLPAVFGVVKDAAGNPLPAALVRAIQITSDVYKYDVREVAVTMTLEDGTYSLDDFLLGNCYRLIAFAPGFLASSSEKFVLEEEQTEINFALARDEPLKDDGPDPADLDEVETILRGARNSLDKFQSGRILFTMSTANSPVDYSGEEIEEKMRIQEEIFRQAGLAEDEMPRQLEEAREHFEGENRRTKWESYEDHTECEYIFKGKNSHARIAVRRDSLPPGYSQLIEEEYVKDSKHTYIQESISIGEDGRETVSRWAQIDGVSRHSSLRSPLVKLFSFGEHVLPSEGWDVTGIQERDGEIVYALENNNDPRLAFTLEIAPEKGYSIVGHTNSRLDGSSNAVYSNRYEDLTWEPAAGMYYPRKIIYEIRSKGSKGQERVTVLINTLKEVELNIDIPDETFDVPFIEGLRVTDLRFDPPKTYKHEYPNALYVYEKLLDRQAASSNGEQPK